MADRILTILTGRNLPRTAPQPSTINEKTLADFTRVVELTGILAALPAGPKPSAGL